MLAEKLVEIIESRSDEIARTWYRDVMENTTYVPSLSGISEDEALEIATNVYRKLGYWLRPSAREDTRETYSRFGESLFFRGFRLEEVVMILILVKRHLWLHLLEQGLLTTNLNIYQALEVNNKVVLYFDRAIYFALVGYKEARAANMQALP